MAIDTGAFANTGGGQASPQPQPGSTPQMIQSPTQGIAQMVQALMAGNSAYKQQQPQFLSPGSAVPGAQGPTAVGGPNGPMPLQPTDPSTMTGGLGSSPVPMPMPRPSGAPMPPSFPDNGTGAVPYMNDPVSQALMSPIPGGGMSG